jgi:hypothetical protein
MSFKIILGTFFVAQAIDLPNSPPTPAAISDLAVDFVKISNQTVGYRHFGSSLKSGYGDLSAFGVAQRFSGFTGTFIVPPLPSSYQRQSVFLWFGVQFAGGDYGVLQPVLMYGPDCCAKV